MSDPGNTSRRVALKVIPSDQPQLDAKTGVPASRAECPDTSKVFCPYLRCRANLARADSDDRAGRRGLGRLERDSRGLTVSVAGNLGGKRAPTTAEPLWLNPDGTMKLAPSCVLDEVRRRDEQPMTSDEIGAAMGRHRTLIARLAKSALAKLKAAGITAEDIRLVFDPDYRRDT